MSAVVIDLPLHTTPHGVVPDYIAHGWRLCTIPPGKKGPVTPGWNLPGNALRTVPEHECNVGLLHSLSGTCALDLDDLPLAADWLAERGVDLQALMDAPDAVQIVSGRVNSGKLLYALPMPLPSKKVIATADGQRKVILELRSMSSEGLSVQDVLPPSRLADGREYRWAGTGDWKALPLIPQNLLDCWSALLAEDEGKQSSTRETPANFSEVASALNSCDPDCDRQTWIELGMAVHDASSGSDEGFDLWNEWSAKSTTKYPGEQELLKQWTSFKAKPGGITVATLFKHAGDRGWTPPPPDLSGVFKAVEQPQPERPSGLKPIPKLLRPVLPFEDDMLPPVLAAWVRDTADRKCWSPDLLAVSILVIASLLVGRKVMLQPFRNDATWRMAVNLWGLLIGIPSAAKSPAVEAAVSFLAPMMNNAETLFDLQQSQYESELDFHMAEVKALEAKRLSLLKGDKDNKPDRDAARAVNDTIKQLKDDFDMRKPVKKRYYTSDTTAEKLFSIFRENPQGICFIADELARLLKQMETDNFATLRSMMMTAWNGNSSHILDRVTGDRSGAKAILCMSMLGGIQPGVLPMLMGNSREGGDGDDGLPQRFGLMVWPDGVRADPDKTRSPDAAAEHAVASIMLGLDWLLVPTDEPRIMPFDTEAERAFNTWRCTMLNNIDHGIIDPSIATYVSKYPKVLGGLALLFALIEGEREVVPMRAWQRAVKWEPYLISHLSRAIGYATSRTDDHARNIVDKLRKGELGESFDFGNGPHVYTTARELNRKGLPGARTTAEARDLLEWLEELGYMTSVGKDVVKGVREPFVINPKVFEK